MRPSIQLVGTSACHLFMCPVLLHIMAAMASTLGGREVEAVLLNGEQSSPTEIQGKENESSTIDREWQGSGKIYRTANIAVTIFGKYNLPCPLISKSPWVSVI